MIELAEVHKRFGEVIAVDGVSFTVGKGEILGFLGPNGAGKSTTMRMITGYLLPDSGKITVNGVDVVEEPEKARRFIGYLPEDNPIYGEMTAYEYIEFGAQMHKLPYPVFRERLGVLVKKIGIKDVLTRKIEELSKGYRQRVGLAHALIHDPQILILDEPTSGLDPSQIVGIRNLIKELSQEKTVILSTHILQEAQNLSDRIIIINKGKIVAQGTPEELEQMAHHRNLVHVVVRSGELDKVLPENMKIIERKERGEEIEYLIVGEEEKDIREEIYKAIKTSDIVLLEMWKERVSLEDVFLELTKEETA